MVSQLSHKGSSSAFSPRAQGKQISLPCCPLQQLQDVTRMVPSVGVMSGQLKAPPPISHQAQDLSQLVFRAQMCTRAYQCDSPCFTHSNLTRASFLNFLHYLAVPSHHALEVYSHSRVFLLSFSLK